MARVRALRDHIEPKVHAYRKEGEEFEYTGKPYDHIEPVSKSRGAAKNEAEPATDEKPEAEE